jgi:hypothetical protein
MPVGRRAWMLRSCATACSMTLRSSPACSRQTVVVGDQRRREIWREIWRRISRQAEAVAQSPIRGIGPRHTEAHRGTPRHTEAHRGILLRRRRSLDAEAAARGAVRVHSMRSRQPRGAHGSASAIGAAVHILPRQGRGALPQGRGGLSPGRGRAGAGPGRAGPSWARDVHQPACGDLPHFCLRRGALRRLLV